MWYSNSYNICSPWNAEVAVPDQAVLPSMPDAVAPGAGLATRPEDARVVRAVRTQAEWVIRDLDATLPEDHLARAIWAFLEGLDLSAFYASIRAVVDRPGRPASDPRVLLALWVYATLEEIGSARHLARLCEEHDAYRWLRGGVPVNYHLLADFRVAHQAALDGLLTDIVATMAAAGLVRLKGVAHDGTRVRASAGQGSFRREARLAHYRRVAREQVERLAREREHPDPGVSARERAARERAARERQARVEQALRQLPAVQAIKERQARRPHKERQVQPQQARVSTTDPEARVMKMADGGFRPAYNVQLASDTGSGVIVGVSVSNRGSDQGEAAAMEQQVVQRTGRHPGAYLADGGFVSLQDIVALEQQGVAVYAPLPPVKSPRARPEPTTPRATDPPEIVAWRTRMGTAEAKTVYKQRAATAEWVNAQVRQHGVRQFSVRGIAKVTCVALLVALTHNLLRWIALST